MGRDQTGDTAAEDDDVGAGAGSRRQLHRVDTRFDFEQAHGAHGRECGAKAACPRYSSDEVSSRRHENVRPFRVSRGVHFKWSSVCAPAGGAMARDDELLQPLSRLALSLSRLS
jgi:hypothetical protein